MRCSEKRTPILDHVIDITDGQRTVGHIPPCDTIILRHEHAVHRRRIELAPDLTHGTHIRERANRSQPIPRSTLIGTQEGTTPAGTGHHTDPQQTKTVQIAAEGSHRLPTLSKCACKRQDKGGKDEMQKKLDFHMSLYDIRIDAYPVQRKRFDMQTQALTISPKYQVVIPQEVREKFGLLPGQLVRWIIHDGMLVLVPVLSIDDLRGYLKDHDIRLIRDKEKFEA